MSQHIDFTQITENSRLRATDTDGSEFTAENAVIIPVVLTDAATLLSGYTPTDPNSPDTITARTIARAVLDALAAYTS